MGLLREYSEVYAPYIGRENVLEEYAGVKIEFVFEETTLFTSDNFLSISLSDDTLSVKLDAVSAEVWASVSSENIGATISIIQRENDDIEILSQPVIGSAFFNGTVPIVGAENLHYVFLAVFSNTRLASAATAYNEKRGVYRVNTDYLPVSLSLPPSYMDVVPYLEKAELKGF